MLSNRISCQLSKFSLSLHIYRLTITLGCEMTISRIHIENIRGFENVTLSVNIRPNCANILVAPNGFGKSSISTAFNCAKGQSLSVDPKDKHKKNEAATAILRIDHDGTTLSASPTKNEISDAFNIYVIKSNIEPKAKLPKINGFTIAQPYLEIPPLDFGPVSTKEKLKFEIDKYKALLSNNGKLVPNFSTRCDNEDLKIELLNEMSSIDKLKQKRTMDLLTEIVEKANNSTGTKTSISEQIKPQYEIKIDEIAHFKTILNIVMKYCNDGTWLEAVIICYILMDLNASDRSNLKKWLQYPTYSQRLKSLKDFIADINSAWVSAEIKETKGRVLVRFPDAASLSNGQRDLLYFTCSLLKSRTAVASKPSILLIDEVFDYLDDANIVVAQYFISKLIDSYRKDGKRIYVCLLTHLDPIFFKGYALRRQQTIYLDGTSQYISETMRKMI